MTQIGMEHVRHLAAQRGALQRRIDSIRDRMAGTTKKIVRTATVGTAALIGGVIQGRAGEGGAHLFHIPVDLGLGVGLNLLSYFNAAGKVSHHLGDAGDGFLASFASSLGFGWGNTWRERGTLFGHSASAALPRPGASTAAAGELSPAEVANIVARVRASAGMGAG